MHTHSETKILPYTTSQLFELVSDVKKYPEFLPWCKAARVTPGDDKHFIGELVIAYKAFSERYTSRVTLLPPHGEHEPAAIDVVQISGPFETLSNQWQFTPLPDKQTQIDFTLEFKFRSLILDRLIGAFFQRATEKMVQAFEERADELWGAKP